MQERWQRGAHPVLILEIETRLGEPLPFRALRDDFSPRIDDERFPVRLPAARVLPVLRRRETWRIVAQREAEQGRCRFGGWQLDRRARRLTDADGAPVALTKGEYALLIAFLDGPQRPLTREHLLQATRIHEDVFDRSIDVQILRLRRKLETNPSSPRIIQTERGVGYVFTLPVESL